MQFDPKAGFDPQLLPTGQSASLMMSHVLVADDDPVRAAATVAMIKRLQVGIATRPVASLVAAYNDIEHHPPAIFFVAAGLADLAEYALICALCKAVGVPIVALDDAGAVWKTRPASAARAATETIGRTSKDLQCAFDHYVGPAKGRIRSARDAGPVFDPDRIILIGASTGGVDALMHVLSAFPESCPPTIIVQHTGAQFGTSLIRLLSQALRPNVVAARNGAAVQSGKIYLAPDNGVHLVLSARGPLRLLLTQGDPVSGHRPSVDRLFASALPRAPNISAAILTGMGRDGAAGLLKLRQAGALTIGQDAKTSVVYGMPRVAYDLGAVSRQLPLHAIGSALLQSCQHRAEEDR